MTPAPTPGVFRRSFRKISTLLCLSAALAWESTAPAASPERSIPIEIRDGLIWMQVSVPGQKAPLHFLLDSGAGCSVVDMDTAMRIGVEFGATERVRRVNANASARRVRGFNASVGGVAVSQTPLALDLSDVSELCSRRVDGLLGHDFFLNRIVQIDYKRQRLRILDSADASPNGTVMRMKVRNGAMCVPVSLNGNAARWTRLDTGCDDALHWVAGRRQAADGITTSSLQLGTEQVPGVRTTLHPRELFPGEAGLLGNGILRNYVVTIDGVSRRLLLQKQG